MKIKPMFDRVIAKEIDKEKTTKSGIFLPTSAQEKPITVQIVSVGAGTNENKMVVNEGEVVLINKYATSEFVFDDEKFVIFKQEDILAKID